MTTITKEQVAHIAHLSRLEIQESEVDGYIEKLEIKPSVDMVFDFKDVNKALDKVANGRSRGKTVLSF